MKLPSKGSSFQPHPTGAHPARLTRIIDLGSQKSTYKGQEREQWKIMLTFESSVLIESGDFAGEPLLVSNRYTASLNEKSRLRKDLESWRGRKFTQQEIETFELKSLLNKPCLLTIVHEDNGDKTFANISSISQLPAQMTMPPASGPILYLSLDPDEFDPNVYDQLSDGLKEVIAKSPEYARATGRRVPAKRPEPAKKDSSDLFDSADDDIPF